MPFLSLKYKEEEGEFISYNNINNYSIIVLEESLNYLVYYFDFKLILCSICNLGINKDYLKAHLSKHLDSLKGKERTNKVTSLYSLLNSIELESLSNSLDLISNFIKLQSRFLTLKELDIIPLYKCLTCSSLYKSKQNIRRHNTEKHKDLKLNPYYIVIKGQSLEPTRFFFEILLKEKDIEQGSISNSRATSLDIESSILDPETSKSNSLEEAKNTFLSSFKKKEEGFLEKLSSFKLNPKEKLSPFQIKTRYTEYINKYNIKDLVDLTCPISKDENQIEILVFYLKEILYLSLEKVTFLSKIYLFLLNSFKKDKIRNKLFNPLLNSSIKVKYFNFYN